MHLAANFAFAASRDIAFTAGGDYLSDFVDEVRALPGKGGGWEGFKGGGTVVAAPLR